ncbi:MAG TPA: FAD-dependent oxidoreductase [Chloroflexota bacterium]|nr:FAD-dependent oxidoreductase [Chloroflexota bacterium]
MNSPQVIVIGGGVIGCASAYALAREGVPVVVLEKDHIAAHASGGAAGILSTLDDEPGSPDAALNSASLALHPVYAERLREETRIDVEYQRAGTLTLLEGGVTPAVRPGQQLLNRAELLELEPAVGPVWTGAVFQTGDGQVNAGRLTRALAEGAARRGAEICEGRIAQELLVDGGRVRGVRTPDGEIRAEHVVLAAGPWSLRFSSPSLPIPLIPTKGEILWVKTRPQALRRPIFAGHYLVPKPTIGLAVGATYRQDGFNEIPALGAVAELAATALRAVPSLAAAAFSRMWSSIRPIPADGRPILGPVLGMEGLIVATGHGAYGIALSLVTGELVRDWVLGRPISLDVSVFSPGRFL